MYKVIQDITYIIEKLDMPQMQNGYINYDSPLFDFQFWYAWEHFFKEDFVRKPNIC